MKKRLKPVRDYGFNKNIKHSSIENGVIIKKGKGLIKTALVYPNTYKTGMSSLGFQTVYKIANQKDFITCERFFLPDVKHSDARQKGRSIKSYETGLSLDKFNIIMFSISFENDFINLVRLLEEADIPLRSSDRNHTHPLVVAGGIACFLNPEPIAAFIDCFLLGEAECMLDNFFDLVLKKDNNQTFLTTLEKQIPGAYVPALHTNKNPFKIKVQYMKSLDTITTSTCIISSDTAFKNTFLIETLKGCPYGCRFCSAGFIYRPPRIYPEKNILTAIDSASGKTDKIGFVSSAVADHPDIDNICNYGLQNGFKLSFSSLRADKLNNELISALSKSKVKTATIAPEAGSQRMRNVINKKIHEHDILHATEKLVNSGIINLKLYFMIGLPFEHDQDIHAIVELTKKIKSIFLASSKQQKKIGTITLSINPFIPKPCTPFQWAAMEDETILKSRVNIIRQGLKKIANIRVNIESLRKAKIHALLSQGDRKTADIIESAIKNGWPAAMREQKTYCTAVIYAKRPIDSPLPWDFLDNRVKKDFLKKEYIRAEQEKESLPCPMIDCAICKTCI